MSFAQVLLGSLVLLAVGTIGMFIEMARINRNLNRLLDAWKESVMGGPAIIPEYPEEGEPDDTEVTGSGGCTVFGIPDCNCLEIFGPNGSCHADALRPSAKDSSGNHTGRFQVWAKYPGQSSFHLFLQSPQVTLHNGTHGWRWTNGGKGWTFQDGTVLEGGFKKSNGDWFDSGPAALTFHC